MTDQKPTGVFVRLPLSDEQIKAVDQIAKEIAENNAECEWRFARHHFSSCDDLVLKLGSAVQVDGIPVITTLGTLRDPVPCVRQSDAQANIAALEAEVVQLRNDLASRKRENFNAGYLIACCNIANMHNEECIASDVLSQAGITEAEVKALDLSEYDANALVEIRKARSEDPILKGGTP